MIPWFHFKCISDRFPLGKLHNQNFCPFSPDNKKNNTNTDSSINQKSPLNLRLLFNQLSDFLSNSIDKNPEKMTNCKNDDIDGMREIKSKLNLLSFYFIFIYVFSTKFLKT